MPAREPPVVAVVTGASSGIGEAIAVALAGRKTWSTLTARRKDRLRSVARRVESVGGRALVAPADARGFEEMSRVFVPSHERWHRLDILVNSAGTGIQASLHDGPVDAWRTMWVVAVPTLALATHLALKQFDPARSGHIINISSTSAHRVPPDAGFYAATKFAVRAITEVLRQELVARTSLTRVISVSSGRVATDFFDAANSHCASHAAAEATMLRPENVAGVILRARRQAT